jgi:hypothetical protein
MLSDFKLFFEQTFKLAPDASIKKSAVKRLFYYWRKSLGRETDLTLDVALEFLKQKGSIIFTKSVFYGIAIYDD